MSPKEKALGGNRGLESQVEKATMTSQETTLCPPSSDIDLQVSTAEEPHLGLWASLDPALDEHRGTARSWRLFLNLTAPSTTDGTRFAQYDIASERPGFAALDEVDEALEALCMPRKSEWQIGSGRGYVCWLDIADLEAL